MGQPDIGDLLRDLRERSGRSQSEQATSLSSLSGRAVTRHEVSRWERGGRLLSPYWQRFYAESFDVPVEPLRQAVAATRARRRQEDPVQRREFIGVLAGLALPSASAPSADRGDVDVRRLRLHTKRLRRLDDVLGGGDTYGVFAAEAERTTALLAASCGRASAQSALASLLAEQHQLAGWAAFDAGRHRQARQHYRDSLAVARDAGDDALAGNALAHVAYQQASARANATVTARASVESAGTATPKVAALLLERSAWAHAVVGDAQGADTALAQAREALQRVDDRAEPDWARWVDEAELDIMSGRCWAELRRPLRAVPMLERALAHVDDVCGRDKALYLTWLASSYLQAREIEQAADTVGRAHDLCAGVASVRPSARIAAVARDLNPHRRVPAVAEVLDRISA